MAHIFIKGRVLLFNGLIPSYCSCWLFILSGVLLYGTPGTGKTLMARACAAQTKVKY
jgi:SpoVK/Ycf46/Vps4 family AAA+-type ATPase